MSVCVGGRLQTGGRADHARPRAPDRRWSRGPDRTDIYGSTCCIMCCHAAGHKAHTRTRARTHTHARVIEGQQHAVLANTVWWPPLRAIPNKEQLHETKHCAVMKRRIPPPLRETWRWFQCNCSFALTITITEQKVFEILRFAAEDSSIVASRSNLRLHLPSSGLSWRYRQYCRM